MTHRSVSHQPTEAFDVFLAMVRGVPRARVLVKDLDRVAPAFYAAGVRLWEAARGRNVPAD